MNQPCQLGFKCPYKGISEECDTLCCYPDIIPNVEVLYGLAEEGDCPLMEDYSDLGKILFAYEQSDTVQMEIERVNREFDEEAKALIEYMKARKAAREQRGE